MEVTVVDATPDPERDVCRAARNDYYDGWIGDTSFEDLMESVGGEDVTTVEEQMEHLIQDLLKRGHYGPFEHPSITISMKGVSRSLMAQITRHRHASFDVQSQRYVDFSDTDPGDLILTPQTIEDANAGGRNPHGKSLQMVIDDTGLSIEDIEQRREDVFEEAIETAVEKYNELIDLGVPPEDARFVLPIGSKVNIVMTVNARMLMHVFDMRAQAESQWEIRELSDELLDIAQDWMPITFEYYTEEMIHRKNRLAP